MSGVFNGRSLLPKCETRISEFGLKLYDIIDMAKWTCDMVFINILSDWHLDDISHLVGGGGGGVGRG